MVGPNESGFEYTYLRGGNEAWSPVCDLEWLLLRALSFGDRVLREKDPRDACTVCAAKGVALFVIAWGVRQPAAPAGCLHARPS